MQQALCQEVEKPCWSSHAIKERNLMWTGWGEPYTGPSQVSASISAGESGRSRSDRGAHTHTHIYVCKVVGEDQICLLLQVTVPFWRGHAWRCPHFEPGVGCMCVWNYQEHCFHSSSAFDFFSWLLRLTFDSRKQCQTQMAMCPITQGVYGWFLPRPIIF